MAGISLCDRCSRFGKGSALGALALNPQVAEREPDTESWEICPSCVAAFKAWMAEGKDKGAGDPPFTEPYAAPADDSAGELEPERKSLMPGQPTRVGDAR